MPLRESGPFMNPALTTSSTHTELKALPVFPLPTAVLLPGTVMPLHLFELRYRQMIEDHLAKGGERIVVVRLQPGFEETYEGRPPIFPIGGVGQILEHEQRADGTHDIVLRGVARAALDELPPREGELYRRAHSRILRDRDFASPHQINTLFTCATSITRTLRGRFPDFELGIGPDDAPSAVIDVVADRLVSDPDIRQNILEERSQKERLDILMASLSRLMVALADHQAPS